MSIYVVLYNSCIYESAAAPIGYFHTLQSAYRFMRKAIIDEFDQHREMTLLYGRYAKGRNYLRDQWWGIKKVQVAA